MRYAPLLLLLSGCIDWDALSPNDASVSIADGASSVDAGLMIANVSGAMTAGATLTIDGNGFGDKKSAAPLRYDDFESGTAGQPIDSAWELDSSTSMHYPIYSNASLRPPSTLSALCAFTSTEYRSRFSVALDSATILYVDFWFSIDPGTTYPSQYDMFRIFNVADGLPSAALTFTGELDGGFGVEFSGNPPASSPPYVSAGAPGLRDFANLWRHVQGAFVMSAAGVGNGAAQLWLDGASQVQPAAATQWLWANAGGTASWAQLSFGEYGQATTAGYEAYFDDVYVDTTLARVEIGDAALYEFATHREIQIPITWSDEQITVKLHLGSFSSTTGLYLYVINASGIPSPGFAL